MRRKGGKEAKGGCPHYYKGEGRVVSEAFWFLGKTPREKLGLRRQTETTSLYTSLLSYFLKACPLFLSFCFATLIPHLPFLSLYTHNAILVSFFFLFSFYFFMKRNHKIEYLHIRFERTAIIFEPKHSNISRKI